MASLVETAVRDADPSTAARCYIIKFNTGNARDWVRLFELYQMEAGGEQEGGF